jgi:hypothetical protein
MPKKKKRPPVSEENLPKEMVEEIDTETTELELEKLQKKIAREERRKRREIETEKQKKAIWLLPSLLFLTMLISWILAHLPV